MLFSRQHRFIFFCNPKTGTTSLEKALSVVEGVEPAHYGMPGMFPARHMPPAIARGFFTDEEWEDTFKFAFVRHPEDWVVSQYRWNFPPPHFYLKKLYWVPLRWRDTLREYRQFRKWIHQEKLDAEAIEFLYQFLRQFRGLPRHDSLFQTTYTRDASGADMLDFVGHFEDFQNAVGTVENRLGLKLDVPHVNRSRRQAPQDVLTKDGRARLRELWACDFEAFGYD